MDQIVACPRGHRYRSTVLNLESRTTCPRCDLADLICLAYGDCQAPPRGCRLLTFRSEPITDFGVLCEVLHLVGRYNRFNPATVLSELEPLFPRLSAVEVGREGSPVIYARVPHWTHQAVRWCQTGMGTPLTNQHRHEIGESFLGAMKRAQADELSDYGTTCRAWWD